VNKWYEGVLDWIQREQVPKKTYLGEIAFLETISLKTRECLERHVPSWYEVCRESHTWSANFQLSLGWCPEDFQTEYYEIDSRGRVLQASVAGKSISPHGPSRMLTDRLKQLRTSLLGDCEVASAAVWLEPNWCFLSCTLRSEVSFAQVSPERFYNILRGCLFGPRICAESDTVIIRS
jgi:hypothetical protein